MSFLLDMMSLYLCRYKHTQTHDGSKPYTCRLYELLLQWPQLLQLECQVLNRLLEFMLILQ